MKKTLLIAALLFTTISVPLAGEKYYFKPVTGVVELFSSQACGACLSAFNVMEQLGNEHSDKLMLTYGVTIWNSFGWVDRFATVKNTERQKNYNNYLGLKSVYTPQSIVGGQMDIAGSSKQGINEYLKKSYLKQAKLRVPMSVNQDEMKLKIKVGDAPKGLKEFRNNNTPIDATLWLVKYKSSAQMDILTGENIGRIINYHNLVADFTPLGIWEGDAREFTVAIRDLDATVGQYKTDKFAFILQLDGVGAIISAVKIQ